MKIAVIDYGAGNLASISNALNRAGATPDITKKPDVSHDGIILPGVGSFDPAMEQLGFLRDTTTNVPVLGICLGMEVFFDTSEEGNSKGLGVIPGDVVSLPDTLKVPHMGWNTLDIVSDSTLTTGVEQNSWAYFVHSYMVQPKDGTVIRAQTDYGTPIPAIIEYDNYIGTQFHPEKSGKAGRTMISNFMGICKK